MNLYNFTLELNARRQITTLILSQKAPNSEWSSACGVNLEIWRGHMRKLCLTQLNVSELLAAYEDEEGIKYPSQRVCFFFVFFFPHARDLCHATRASQAEEVRLRRTKELVVSFSVNVRLLRPHPRIVIFF